MNIKDAKIFVGPAMTRLVGAAGDYVAIDAIPKFPNDPHTCPHDQVRTIGQETEVPLPEGGTGVHTTELCGGCGMGRSAILSNGKRSESLWLSVGQTSFKTKETP